MNLFNVVTDGYTWMLKQGDPRVAEWFLMFTPFPTLLIIILYLLLVWLGPKYMTPYKPLQLRPVIVLYNSAMVGLSAYMLFEFFMTSYLDNYSLKCQPVDYSDRPLAIRMGKVCWWFFFSKIIEIMDTVFFILRKKQEQVTFLHVYHHCTMIINWWLGVKFVAGGQSWFLAMVNCFVHIIMYSYYALSAVGPHMHKYLWWKKYITNLQLSQFFLICLHTGYNIMTDCDFPQGYNYAVFIYAISLIMLFSNFYYQTYVKQQEKVKTSINQKNGHKVISTYTNGHVD